MGKRQNTRKHRTQESQEIISGDHKAARNRQISIIRTNEKHKQQKDPHKKHCLGTVSKILTGGLQGGTSFVGHLCY